MIILVEEKRKGMPYTRKEFNLIKLSKLLGGYKEPKDADEFTDDFWFFEKGKGFFIGDSEFFSGKYTEEDIGGFDSFHRLQIK